MFNALRKVVALPAVIAATATTAVLLSNTTETNLKEGSKHTFLYSWGNNLYGQLGQGTEKNKISPTLVEHLEHNPVSAIFANGKNSAAIVNNEVWTFGGGANGILGHGDAIDQPNQTAPKKIVSLSNKNIKYIAVGGFHMLAHDEKGEVLYSWGRNNAGQLGLGEGKTGNHGDPQTVSGVEGTIASVAAGRQHSLVLTSSGAVYSFGNGRDAQLGLGDKKYRKAPSKIEELPPNVVSIACGRDSSFALTSEGILWSWGKDEYGQLGHGRTQRYVTLPRRVASLDHEKIVSIHMGEYHGCAVSSDGRMFTWGKNSDGQCGHGHKNNVTQPTQVEALEALNVVVSSADCGDGHTAAITEKGELWLWGRGTSGELGRGAGKTAESNAAYRSVPVKVPLELTATSVALGAEHTLCVLE